MFHSSLVIYNHKLILRAQFIQELSQHVVYRTVTSRAFRATHSQKIETLTFGN